VRESRQAAPLGSWEELLGYTKDSRGRRQTRVLIPISAEGQHLGIHGRRSSERVACNGRADAPSLGLAIYIAPSIHANTCQCLRKSCQPHSPHSAAIGFMAGCVGWAIVATYSLSNGILIWPGLLLTAAGLRLRLRIFLPIGIFAGLMGVAYFSGAQFVVCHTNPLESLQKSVRVLGYVCSTKDPDVLVRSKRVGAARNAGVYPD
jgi:hypothetical protein